jgi:hypothetical protein
VADRPFPLDVFLPIPEERNRFYRFVVADRPFPPDVFLPIPEERNRFYRFVVADRPFHRMSSCPFLKRETGSTGSL